jgi:hypothetical protein
MVEIISMLLGHPAQRIYQLEDAIAKTSTSYSLGVWLGHLFSPFDLLLSLSIMLSFSLDAQTTSKSKALEQSSFSASNGSSRKTCDA